MKINNTDLEKLAEFCGLRTEYNMGTLCAQNLPEWGLEIEWRPEIDLAQAVLVAEAITRPGVIINIIHEKKYWDAQIITLNEDGEPVGQFDFYSAKLPEAVCISVLRYIHEDESYVPAFDEAAEVEESTFDWLKGERE